ncbi:MAG: hypothetical protein AAF387_20310, partial [Pseudomonadota bacterium]
LIYGYAHPSFTTSECAPAVEGDKNPHAPTIHKVVEAYVRARAASALLSRPLKRKKSSLSK